MKINSKSGDGDDLIETLFGSWGHNMFSDPDRSGPAISYGGLTERLTKANTYEKIETELDKLRKIAAGEGKESRQVPRGKERQQLTVFLDTFEKSIGALALDFKQKAFEVQKLLEGANVKVTSSSHDLMQEMSRLRHFDTTNIADTISNNLSNQEVPLADLRKLAGEIVKILYKPMR